MQLSKRLSAVAEFVTPGGCLVDVGTDHGYVPIALLEQKKISSAIAMDVNRGPLERAREHIAQYNMGDYIATRLSDGLHALQAGEGDSLLIAGMGGGAFPAYLKLHSAIGRVDALLLNGAECEPYLTADERLMEERPEAIIGGTRLLMRCLALDRAVIGVEGNKYAAVAALRKQLPLRGGDVEVRTLRARYPQGSEKQLIQKLTGRRVPTGKLPADAGCVVFNVATAAAVYDAVYDAVPLTRRVVTVAGSAVAEPKNLLVPLGTPLEDLIREAGGWCAPPDRVLAGGPMMGAAQFDLSTPVTKGTSAVLGLVAAEIKPANRPEGPCLRCGRCIEACPMGLEPVYLHLYADHGRVRELAGLHIMDCTECGACAYGCPARIRLVHSIRSGKQQLRSLQEKNRGEGGAG